MMIVERAFREATDAAAGGNPGLFVTLEATGDADKWVQLTWDVINASYPHQDEPAARLKRHDLSLPHLVEVSDWVPGQYGTFAHGAEPLAPLVQFVERYLREVLEVEPDERSLIVSRGE